jgi:hypothetical protein
MNWIKREAPFEFYALQCAHSSENIAAVTLLSLSGLWVKHKTLAITTDNDLNNNNLVEDLNRQFQTGFDIKVDYEDGNLQLVIKFRKGN